METFGQFVFIMITLGMLQITPKELIVPDDVAIRSLQQEFLKDQCIVLRGFLEEHLMQRIIKNLNKATFFENQHTGIKNEIFATDQTVNGADLVLHQINILMNNPLLFRTIEKITGCKKILSFAGRIYRNMPGTGHHLNWHDDTIDASRLIAISINLGAEPFEGGVFEIREKKGKTLLKSVGCGKCGDAHVFNVSDKLEHRVTETTGQVPRIAAAGWFLSQASSSSPYTTK
jgi:hypothetical protein